MLSEVFYFSELPNSSSQQTFLRSNADQLVAIRIQLKSEQSKVENLQAKLQARDQNVRSLRKKCSSIQEKWMVWHQSAIASEKLLLNEINDLRHQNHHFRYTFSKCRILQF